MKVLATALCSSLCWLPTPCAHTSTVPIVPMAGMTVVMVSKNPERLELASQTVHGAICKPCDVTKRADVHALVEEVVGKFHQVDLLVNCAGCMYFTL